MSVHRWAFWLMWSWRDLRRRWALVAAIAGVVAIGTGLATGLGSMETWRIRSNDGSFAASHAHDLRVSLADGSFARPGDLLAAARSIPDASAIAQAEERLTVRTQLTIGEGDSRVLVPATLYGVPVTPGPHVDAVTALEGRPLATADAGEPVTLLHAMFARGNGMATRGTIELAGGKRVRYVGLATSPDQFVVIAPTGLYSGAGGYGVLYASLATAQRLTSRHDAVNELVLRLRDPRRTGRVDRELRRALAADTRVAPLGAQLTRGSEEDAYRILYEDARNDQEVFDAFTVLVLVAAGFAAFNLINRVVEGQRRELGIGMALGVPRTRLAIRPILLGLEIATLGVVFGVFTGWAIGDAMAAVLRDRTALPVLDTGFRPEIFVRGAAIGFLVPVLATLYPVWRGVRAAPLDAIRTGPRAAGTAGLAGTLRHVPLPGGVVAQLPFRNLLRTPRRTLTTILAVASVITIVISFGGMIDSFVATVDKTRGDLLATAPNRVSVTLDRFYPVGSPQVRGVARSPLAGASSAGFSLAGRVSSEAASIDIIVEAVPFGRAVWTPRVSAGRLPARPNELMLAEKAARDLRIGVGDSVLLTHPRRTGPASFALVKRRAFVVGLHRNPLRVLAYVDYRAAAPAFGVGGQTNLVTIDPRPTIARAAAERALFANAAVVSLQPVSGPIDEIARSIDQFKGVIRVAELAALVLTVLIAFNAIAINVEERKRDVATMFAFGLPLRTVTRIGIVENVVVGIVGTIVGVGTGTAVLAWIVHSMFPETFPEFGVVVHVAGESLAIAAIVGIGALAAAPLFVWRRLRRTDIPSTLRVVE